MAVVAAGGRVDLDDRGFAHREDGRQNMVVLSISTIVPVAMVDAGFIATT